MSHRINKPVYRCTCTKYHKLGHVATDAASAHMSVLILNNNWPIAQPALDTSLVCICLINYLIMMVLLGVTTCI